MLATSPWPTHYFMMVPTAWAFRAAGHDVLVASQPSMSALITRSGLPAAEVGPDVDLVAIRKRTLPFERKAHEPAPTPTEAGDGADEVFGAWRDATTASLTAMVELAREWQPQLVLADPMCPAGLVAAHVVGAPAVRHLWAPDFLGSAEGDKVLSQIPGFYEPYERFGLTLAGDPAIRTVDPCPPSMEPPPSPNRRHVRFVPYNGPGRWRGTLPPVSPRPRVCLTWGVSVTRIVGETAFALPTVVRALAPLPVDIVVAIDASQRAMLGEVPDHVEVLESPPLHMLLPRCDLIVHQGGAGSTLTAARFGLRQVAITYLPDQANVAVAFSTTSAGIHLPGEAADEASIRAAVQALLDEPRFTEAAQRLREEIAAQPSPGRVAAELASLVPGHAPLTHRPPPATPVTSAVTR